MMDEAPARDDGPGGGRFARLWPLLWLIWLPNLAVPLVALLRAHPTPLRLGAILIGLTLFVAVYLWAAWRNDLSRVTYPISQQRATIERGWIPVAVLAGVSVACTLGDGPHWLVMLIFTGASVGGRFPLGRALGVLAALALLAGLLGWLTHDAWSDIVSATFWSGMAGVLVIILSYFRRTNRALRIAREENARLAVEAERLRFSRDLHDLLGHDLARIALQSEVAEALVPTEPERAMATMREVGGAARTALHEVRAAVAGYRQPALASELRGAGEILAAAGIAYRCEGEQVPAPPAVEAALAWAVREGVTNVVKHSGARCCTIRVTGNGGYAGVDVSDDGAGAAGSARLAPASGYGGHGLRGLAERTAALGGRCDAGPCPDGGYRLSLTLPLEKDGATERAQVEYVVAIDAGRRR